MYSIKARGAVGDGKTKDTAAIQKAIDACAAEGGGTVFFEPGVYLTGTLYLRSNVELHLAAGAKILGSTQPEDYADFKAPGFKHEFAPEKNTQCLICASGESNIAITGSGEINGEGPAFYDTAHLVGGRFYGKPDRPRPRMVIFYKCRDVRIEGVSFVDSPCWTFWLINCQRVNIHRIKVIGDQKMINNDGIDVDSCQDVTISDCFIKTCDDCLVLRAIQEVQDDPAICENVTITNCTLDSCCQGVRVGCPSDGVIRNCALSNLVIDSEANGINFDNPQRYLANQCKGRVEIHDILFSNVQITCKRHPIRLFVEEGVTLRRLSGISFSNFRIRSDAPCLVVGSKDTLISDVSFDHVRMETVGDDGILCRNCRGITFNNVTISNVASPKVGS